MRFPPRVDLARLGTVGMVQFASPGRAELGADTSRQFLASLESAQPGAPVQELGDAKRLLYDLGRRELDAEAARALGEKFHVDALIVGTLESKRSSAAGPADSHSKFSSSGTELQGLLHAQIFDTHTGAIVWNHVVRAEAEISGAMQDDLGAIGADEAQMRLATRLAKKASADFQPRTD
ncbi:MAG TPA: hypothetical protein VMR50_22215 [Myxococcota bacterium]|nr:hypothetical protein [Myxococcota bacterium]